MTSTISTTGINTNYPVAGVANDSQGFRDNFLAIKTQLDTAAGEVTVLQDYTAKLNEDNSFAGNLLENYKSSQELTAGYQFSTSLGTGTVTLDWQNGSFQYCTASSVDGTRTLAFSNFGTTGHAARMTVMINLAATGGTTDIDLGTVKVPSALDGVAGVALADGVYIFEFLTKDAGTTIYLTNYQDYPN